MAKWGSTFVPSSQVSSVTWYTSSISSDRSHPGVSETAVASCGASSWARANAIRPTDDFTRS